MMTRLEFRHAAKRGALVEWERSGMVEWLYMTHKTKAVYALNLLTRKAHLIIPSKMLNCRVMELSESVRLFQLLPRS